MCKLYFGQKIILCWLHALIFFHFKIFRDDWIPVAWTSVFLMRKGTRWKPGREGTMEQLHELLTQYNKNPGCSLTDEYSGVVEDQKGTVPVLTLTTLNWSKCKMLPPSPLFTMSCLAPDLLVLAAERLWGEPSQETDVAEN